MVIKLDTNLVVVVDDVISDVGGKETKFLKGTFVLDSCHQGVKFFPIFLVFEENRDVISRPHFVSIVGHRLSPM